MNKLYSNNRTYAILYIVCLIFLLTSCSIKKSNVDTINIQSTQTIVKTDLQQKDIDYLEQFEKDYPDYQILDYVYGKKNSNIIMAITYNDDHNKNTNIAIITKEGTGLIDLSGGDKHISLDEEDSIILIGDNAVGVTLYNDKIDEFYHYQVKSVIKDGILDFDVSSSEMD